MENLGSKELHSTGDACMFNQFFSQIAFVCYTLFNAYNYDFYLEDRPLKYYVIRPQLWTLTISLVMISLMHLESHFIR